MRVDRVRMRAQLLVTKRGQRLFLDLERRQNRHLIFRSLVALDAVGIAHKPPGCENRGRQTHKPSTVTLAAHTRRGLISTWLLTAQTKPEENWESTLVGFDQFT